MWIDTGEEVKRLFNDNGELTTIGKAYDEKIELVVRPLVEEMFAAGCPVSEVKHLLMGPMLISGIWRLLMEDEDVK